MEEYEVTVNDEEDNEHLVTVFYTWDDPISATSFDPAEGGVTIEEIKCETLELSNQQKQYCEDKCIDYSYSVFRDCGFSG